MKKKLEVCIDNSNGIEACVIGKVDRIELCSSLTEGGLTPSVELMREASLLKIPVRVMIRPKSDSFHYSSSDIQSMCNDIDIVRSFGFEGVVFGATKNDDRLDQLSLKILCDHATGLKKTLHRAIDSISDPIGAVDLAVDLGFDFILSSGGAENAEKGLSVLKEMNKRANGNIEIMPGSGVNISNVKKIAFEGGFKWFHSSCSSQIQNNSKQEQIETYASYTDSKKIISLRNAIN